MITHGKSLVRRTLTGLAIGVAALAPCPARAAGLSYTIQALLSGGSRAGDFTVGQCTGPCYDLGGLSDAGEAVIDVPGGTGSRALVAAGPGGLAPIVRTGDTLGGIRIDHLLPGFLGPSPSGHTLFMAQDSGGKTVLAQYAAGTGKVTVIAAEGGSAPGGGTWGGLTAPTPPGALLMNDHGNAVFDEQVELLSSVTFHWDSQAQSLTPVAIAGRKAGDVTLSADVSLSYALNNREEMVLGAVGSDGAGNAVGGWFLLDQQQNLRPVALLGQPLPDGDQLADVTAAVLNDRDTVALVGVRKSDQKEAVYLWANGTLMATGIAAGASAPIGGKFGAIASLRLNNVSDNLLVAAHLNGDNGPGGFFLFANGKLRAVSAPGQPLPDGSTSRGFLATPQVSRANAAGEIAFVTAQSDGGAVYLLEPDGRLSQVLKTGAATSLGVVSDFPLTPGFADGIALNGKGQFALPVTFDTGTGRTEVVALLTPAG